MNKLYLKSIFAAWLMLCVGVSAWAATTYCGTTITSENQKQHSAAITCSSLGENRYLFEFVSEDEFTSYNAVGSNFYMNVNGVGGYQVSKYLTKDGKRLYVEFTSTSVPNIYVGDFYVQYSDGEAHYKIPTDADFSKVCSGSTKQASDLTLIEPATTILDLQIGDEFSIRYTTSSTGAVAFSSSNTDVATVSAAGVITALTAGTTTITVSQAEDETYNAESKSFTLSVIDKPQMISASLERVDMNNAYVRVSATDAVTSFADLKYACILTQGEHVYQFEMSAANGILHLKDMPACSEHTLEIWAINKDGKKSDNSIKVHFTTECDVADLWLAGSMNALSDGNWNPRDDNYQFRKTKVAGVYSLTKHLKKGSYVYKLTEGSFDSGKCTNADHHLILSEDMDVTFYARGVNNFASSADSIFLIGTATSDFLPESGDYKPAWDCKANGKYCEWNTEHTSAIWTGNVYGVSGDTKGEYKIVKIAYLNGTENGMPYVYWNDLWEAHQTIHGVSESSTEASFIFDLPTLSWSWHEVYAGQCTFSGGAGDGQTSNGSETFTKGYNLSLYLNAERTHIHITAEFLDDETPSNAYVQNYPQRDETMEINEFTLAQRQGTKTFDGDIPVSELKNKADGIIRFGVKFAFAGGLRVTTPEFYYLDGSGCAERDFVIYHHDQMLEKLERDAVYTFKGGRILQPIVYKRKLKPGIWETLSLPFDVSKITVSDEGVEYELHAQYTDNNTTHKGEFWLRDFREKEVSAEYFQANWHDIQATTAEAALPKKNVPYIIRVPDDDTHYWKDKYIVFHGASYQTIDDVYSTDVQTPRATEMFAYSGNNTMKEWQLRSAYVLDSTGIYFESGETVTLYPFECAVNAEIETTRAMPRLALNRKPATPTGNLPPTTAVEPGNVWSVMGWYVGSFCDSNQYDRLMQRLPAGMYVVRQAETTYKVYIAK